MKIVFIAILILGCINLIKIPSTKANDNLIKVSDVNSGLTCWIGDNSFAYINNHNLIGYDITTGTSTQLTSSGCSHADYCPINNKLLISGGGGGTPYIMNVGDPNYVPIGYQLGLAAWSHDGTKIADDSNRLHVLTFTEGGITDTYLSWVGFMPRWGPGDKCLVYTIPNYFGYSMYKWNFNDNTETCLGVGNLHDVSKDGIVIFTENGNTELWMMDIKDTTNRWMILSNINGNNGCIGLTRWSFDGTRILVQTISGTYLYKLDTTPPTITITSPTDNGIYAANSGLKYSFCAVDDKDPKPAVSAIITSFDGTQESVSSGSPFPTSSGVYILSVTANDVSGNSAQQSVTFIVFDPTAGYVGGAGWINSPAGAFKTDPTLTGKANFAFESKYSKGKTAPDGNTQFKFKDGNLDFKSTSYEWLAISGAKAQYKGEGIINGAGVYKFVLTAIDGDLKGKDQPDLFRIKIWDKATGNLVYDNQLGAPDEADPTTSIGGGNIQIKK